MNNDLKIMRKLSRQRELDAKRNGQNRQAKSWSPNGERNDHRAQRRQVKNLLRRGEW